MIGLELRDEFKHSTQPETAIVLKRAASEKAENILGITYPTADIQTALKAVSTIRAKKPLVLKGDRGRGKSHIMAVIHHALASPDVTKKWASSWGDRLGLDLLKDLEVPVGFLPISEAVHNHEYPHLWDLLFDRHPKGQEFKGRFKESGHTFPKRSLIEEMFEAQPVVLILDEFQKWFDGLHDESGSTGKKEWTWASNFIQNLSEIAVARPEILILVVSVLNNDTEAFQQIHRDGPVVIDFQGPSAKVDRQRLVLHRLFKNRIQIGKESIDSLIATYVHERARLKDIPASEHASAQEEVARVWPFAPELLDLLDEHILMSKAAQESRDLIRILASVYRARGDKAPIITPADFQVDDDSCGVQTLLNSIATSGEQEELRSFAQQNLQAVKDSGASGPLALELISAIWMRSMTPSKTKGASREQLQLDITRTNAIDDNQFLAELTEFYDNSKTLHGWNDGQGRIWLGLDENPQTVVKSTARNDRLWTRTDNSTGNAPYPGKDLEHIRGTLKHLFRPENRELPSQVIILGPNWRIDPWDDLEPGEKPDGWTKPVVLVIPEVLEGGSEGASKILGPWLVENVHRNKNYVRFLLPGDGKEPLYSDKEVRFLARCSYLCKVAWQKDSRYYTLRDDFDRPLRKKLGTWFDRLAMLVHFNYGKPEECTYEIDKLDQGKLAAETAFTIEDKVLKDFYDKSDFERLVIDFAVKSRTIAKLLEELAEPPATGPEKEVIPFLGSDAVYEEVLRIASRGRIALNVSGEWFKKKPEHEDEESAYRFLRGKAFRTGGERDKILLGEPSSLGGSTTSSTTQTTQTGSGVSSGSGSQSPSATGGTSPSGDIFGEGESDDQTGGGAAPTSIHAPQPDTTGAESIHDPIIQTKSTPTPAKGMNLLGCFEQWGVKPDKALRTAKIELSDISVGELKSLITRMPSSLQALLEIQYEEDGEQ